MILLTTVLAVSVDAYLAGLAYNLNRKLSKKEVLYAGSFTFFSCYIALLLRESLSRFALLVDLVGALIFIFLGAKNYLGSTMQKRLFSRGMVIDREVWMLGLAVSADGAIACLAFSVQLIYMPIYALLMCVGHTLFLALSTLTVRLIKLATSVSIISSVALIGLGIYKLFILFP